MEKKKKQACCEPEAIGKSCCSVLSIVTVDERGQMVLPKDLRDAMNIKAGDKLAVVTMESKKPACCIMLLKTNELEDLVKQRIEPIIASMQKGMTRTGKEDKPEG